MALIFLFAILLALLSLLLRAEARLKLALCPEGIFAAAELRLWFGLVKIRVKRMAQWESMLPLAAGRGGRGRPGVMGLDRAMRLESVSVLGRIPGSGDAGRAAVASGLLNGLVTAAGSALGARTVSLVTPDFVSDALWLNLEGILTLRPGKFIIIAAGNAATEVIKHVTSDRKHNADEHGAVEGDGGR